MLFKLRRSQMPIVLSDEPVATMWSEPGAKAIALIASVWPVPWSEDFVVSDSRVSRIWRVRSSETVPIIDLWMGWY